MPGLFAKHLLRPYAICSLVFRFRPKVSLQLQLYQLNQHLVFHALESDSERFLQFDSHQARISGALHFHLQASHYLFQFQQFYFSSQRLGLYCFLRHLPTVFALNSKQSLGSERMLCAQHVQDCLQIMQRLVLQT